MYDSACIPLPPPIRAIIRDREENGKRASSERMERRTWHVFFWYCIKEKLFHARPFYFRISIFIYDFKEYVMPPRFNKEQKRFLSDCRRPRFFESFGNLYTRNWSQLDIYALGVVKIILPLALDLLGLVKRYPSYGAHYWNNAGFLHHVRSCLQDRYPQGRRKIVFVAFRQKPVKTCDEATMKWNFATGHQLCQPASCEIIAVGNVIPNGCSIYTTLLLS